MEQWEFLFKVIEVVVLPLLLWTVKLLIQIEGRVRTLEEWREGHHELDNERFSSAKERLERLEGWQPRKE